MYPLFAVLSILHIAVDMKGWGYQQNIFLFLHKNIYCGYPLEVPHQGTSNGYPQYMFPWRNKKTINNFRLKNVPYLKLWYTTFTVYITNLIVNKCIKPLVFSLLLWCPIEIGKDKPLLLQARLPLWRWRLSKQHCNQGNKKALSINTPHRTTAV